MGTGCLANIVRISCFQFQTPSVHWEPIDPGEANDPGRPGRGDPGTPMEFGVSTIDGCIGWEET